MTSGEQRSLPDEECQRLAQSKSLSIADVIRLFAGQVSMYGDGDDPVLVDDGFRARELSPEDWRGLSPEEQAVLANYKTEVALDIPCEPRQLVAWADRNQIHELPQSFVDAIKRGGSKASKRGRPRKLAHIVELATAAATAFYGIHPNTRRWPPYAVVRHGEFIQAVFGRGAANAADVKSERGYTKAYRTNPRALVKAVTKVWNNLKNPAAKPS